MSYYCSTFNQTDIENITYYILKNFPDSKSGSVSFLGDIKEMSFKKNSSMVYRINYTQGEQKHCFYAFEITITDGVDEQKYWKYVLKNDVITIEEFEYCLKYYFNRRSTYKDWAKFFVLDITKSQFIFKKKFFENFKK